MYQIKQLLSFISKDVLKIVFLSPKLGSIFPVLHFQPSNIFYRLTFQKYIPPLLGNTFSAHPFILYSQHEFGCCSAVNRLIRINSDAGIIYLCYVFNEV